MIIFYRLHFYTSHMVQATLAVASGVLKTNLHSHLFLPEFRELFHPPPSLIFQLLSQQVLLNLKGVSCGRDGVKGKESEGTLQHQHQSQHQSL